jgi:hypothetical protein
MGQTADVEAGEQQPDNYSHQVKDADDIIRRGMIRIRLVTIMEPVDFRDEHPPRQRCKEQENLS